MAERTFTLVFTQEQLQLLGQGLGLLPYAQVAVLIDGINKQIQVQAQLAPSNEASE